MSSERRTMAILTVFTPAYNRAHTLSRTYQSLKEQNCKDFVWLIVDDGSTDNTAEIVKKWQDEVFTHLSKTPAVAGKPLMIVTTTGSEYDAYRSGGRNRFTTDELLRPYQGSAIHSGMAWQTPIVVYGMGTADAGKNIAEGANSYKQRIEMLINSSNAGNNW